MSDHNPSDSFDNNPENSGCSNDDFEQVLAPGSAPRYYQDVGDADGADAVGSDLYDYDYDPEQGAEVSTTTADTGEDEAEADRYAAGASEAEAYSYNQEPLISFGDGDDDSFETHDSVQPSAPVPDTDPAIAFASSTAADILSTIAPSASPPSGHYDDYEPSSSTNYEYDHDGYEFNDTGKEIENEVESFPDETATEAAASYEQPTPPPDYFAESVSSTSNTDILTERKSVPVVSSSEETPKEPFLRGVDPREINDEEADISRESQFLKDLIYWRDVKKTGVVFGATLVVLLSLALLSVISVVAYLSLALLTATFSFVIYKKVMSAVSKSSDSHPFRCILDKDISLNEDRLKCVIKATLKNVNATAKELRHLFLVEDTVDSIKFGILLWALTYIGSWFSDMSLVIIVLVLVFSVPKLYETYQVQIDNYIGLAKAQINKYLSIIQSKLPFLKKKEKAH